MNHPRFFTDFTEARLSADPPDVQVILSIGILHGVSAQFVCWSKDGSRVWFLDEVHPDADSILDMLARNGFGWGDVGYWTASRASEYSGGRKSNSVLMAEFAKALERPVQELQIFGLRITTPYKSPGGITRGCRDINHLFKSNRAVVSPRCSGLIEGLTGWTGRDVDPLRGAIDAARFALQARGQDFVPTPHPQQEDPATRWHVVLKDCDYLLTLDLTDTEKARFTDAWIDAPKGGNECFVFATGELVDLTQVVGMDRDRGDGAPGVHRAPAGFGREA